MKWVKGKDGGGEKGPGAPPTAARLGGEEPVDQQNGEGVEQDVTGVLKVRQGRGVAEELGFDGEGCEGEGAVAPTGNAIALAAKVAGEEFGGEDVGQPGKALGGEGVAGDVDLVVHGVAEGDADPIEGESAEHQDKTGDPVQAQPRRAS